MNRCLSRLLARFLGPFHGLCPQVGISSAMLLFLERIGMRQAPEIQLASAAAAYLSFNEAPAPTTAAPFPSDRTP